MSGPENLPIPNAQEIAQTQIKIIGLMPDVVDGRGNLIQESNINDPEISQQINIELTKHPWLHNLMQEVNEQRKSAWFKTVVGGFIITAAVGAVELGLRDGKDVRHLAKYISATIISPHEDQP